MALRERFDAVLLLGPAGSGKSFLGRRLNEREVASYVELEPILRARFGTGEAFRARLREVGAFMLGSYREQLRSSALPVAIESAGVMDRSIVELLLREHRVATVLVRTPRHVCAERVVARPAGGNISATADRELVGRFYDIWFAKVAPSYRFDLEVDGADADAAVEAIRAFLG
jgi:hypothetical protein